VTSPQVPNREAEHAHDDTAALATYWDISDVQYHCRLGRSAAWRLVRRDGFPAPVVLSQREVLWPRDEVIAFLDKHRDPQHYNKDLPAPAAPARAGQHFMVRAVRSRR
jgi:predicted DNA-binding transcriptional regulator AlpA